MFSISSTLNEIYNNDNEIYNLKYYEKNKSYINYNYYKNKLNNLEYNPIYSNLLQYNNSTSIFNNNKLNNKFNDKFNKKFNELSFKNIINPINSSCCISLNKFNKNSEVVQINECKHLFCKESNIKYWINNNKNCPLCRCKIN